MSSALAFARRPVRPARIGIVGFGDIAQAHCRYLLADRSDDEDSVLTVFPGIRDDLGLNWPGRVWPGSIGDPALSKAIDAARIVFVPERVSNILPIPDDTVGYAIETTHDVYRFEELYLEPATVPASVSARRMSGR